MTDYGFGYIDDNSQGQGQSPAQEPQSEERAPKWYRDHMDKTSREMNELRQKLAQREVADALKAKGYDPGVATLYQGDPAKVDEWLTANGSYLAKAPGSAEPAAEQEQQPAGPPASIVSPESQAALARMQNAGAEGAAAPLGSDQEMAAKIAACKDDDELNALLAANGNRYV